LEPKDWFLSEASGVDNISRQRASAGTLYLAVDGQSPGFGSEAMYARDGAYQPVAAFETWAVMQHTR
jgi:hypothetical protein